MQVYTALKILNKIFIKQKKILFGGLALVLALSVLVAPDGRGVAWADAADGVAAYRRGDYQAAIREWMPLAAQGDTTALYNLGQLYRLGQGVDKDLALAEQYYLRAAERGHVLAQGNLGTLYYFKKPRPDVASALKWWRRAARAGNARAQYMLAHVYFNGDVVPRDYVRANAWMILAVKAGLADALKAQKLMLPHLSADEVAQSRALAPQLLAVDATPSAMAPSVSSPLPALGAAPSQAAEPKTTGSQTTERRAAGPRVAGPQVQLGAFSSRDRALAAWDEIRRRPAAATVLEGLSPVIKRIVPAAGGRALFRLRAGPFADKTAARQACARLKAAGIACFPVSPAP
jgi:cell division septation protein DedD